MDPPVVDSLVAKDIHLHPHRHHASDSSDSNSDEVQLAERGIAIKPENVGKPQADEDYVTGFKLALVLGCITLVYFLMMLDVTILATVRPRHPSLFIPRTLFRLTPSTGNPLYHQRLPFPPRRWMVC